MVDLTGKAVLITGASRGIGAATARVLAQAGAVVGLMARSEEAVAKLEAAGDLEGDDPGSVSELTDKHQLFGLGQRNNIDPRRRLDPVKRMRLSRERRLHGRLMDIEDLAMLQMLFFEHAPDRRCDS